MVRGVKVQEKARGKQLITTVNARREVVVIIFVTKLCPKGAGILI